MENTPRSYALALLKLMGNQEGANEDNPPLGWALHLETQSSIFNLAAHRLLPTLIEYSPSPEAVAQQFMTELAQCENSAVIDLVDSLNSDRSVSPANWAAAVYEGLRRNGNISPLTNLAVLYLNDLVIPFRYPAGTRRSPTSSPTSSQSLTPNPMHRDNNSLLESANVHSNQVALKELVLRRDGARCVITRFPFVGRGRVPCNCAHIIPFSVHNKTAVHTAIEMFTGNEVRAAEVQHLINHPINAINMGYDARVSMDQNLAWGIEARSANDGWKYYFRVVKPDDIYGTIQLNDGDEIEFGKGDDGNTIELPDPRLCNLRLAIARVFAASGFAEVVDKILEDNGGGESALHFVDDLSHRLAMVAVLGYRFA